MTADAFDRGSTRKPATESGHDAEAQLEDLERAARVRPMDARPEIHDSPSTDTTHWVDELEASENRDRRVPQVVSMVENSFQLVVQSRASRLTEIPPPGDALWNLLEALATPRSKRTDSQGRPWSSRIYPSAGGTHCIRFLAFTSGVEGWRSGWHRFNPIMSRPEAVQLSHGAQLLRSVSESVRRPYIYAALVAIADLKFLNDRYPNATSLAWRDAGAALAVAHLLAEDLGLRSSISGASTGLRRTPTRPIYSLGALIVSAPESHPG